MMEKTMQTTTPPGQLKYLYAVIANSGSELAPLMGIGDRGVYTIEQNGLAAVISDIEVKRVRPERKNLTAHQRVLNGLNTSLTPLPVAFGVIAKDTASIKKILKKNKALLAEQLELVDGKVEMTLKVHLNVPDIFAHFVSIHPELKKLRKRYFSGTRTPSHDEKIELGRLFENLLMHDREEHTEHVQSVLDQYCVDILQNKCKDERMVMHLSCLVERKRIDEFEKAIFTAAAGFDNSFNFDYSGPWVVHSFVDLHLEM